LYENDNQTIEEEFSRSWDRIEEFFTHLSNEWGWLIPILGLIAQMRERGYDRQFRAGQSMEIFVLSRALNHGLRPEQAAFRIELQMDDRMHLRYLEHPDVHIEMDVDRVEITPEVEEFLTRLLAHPID
jgi:hypothetical protein